MKKLFALLLVCVLCLTTAYAAEWREGLGPDQPLPGVRKLDLSKEMGYSYTYPRPGIVARNFCDVLEIYLPREDITLGTGHAHLYDSEGEVADIDFADPAQVELRLQEESELVAKGWGSGVCIEMHLPVSLAIGESYYVLMDLNCFSANGGKTSNYDLTKPTQWTPVLEGDFGISRLFYAAPPALPEPAEETEEEEELDEQEEMPEPTEAPEPEPLVPKYGPVPGDIIQFDLVLGGEAKTAVMFSENDSVYFEELEYTQSGPVTGTVTGSDLDWGVVFLDENDNTLQVIMPARVELDAEAGEEEEAPEEETLSADGETP
ncbi:MAG: hypothetical protein IJH38_01535 [Clostridia bacterium]|nr:hypothetical protein [Clostridia bacterium]